MHTSNSVTLNTKIEVMFNNVRLIIQINMSRLIVRFIPRCVVTFKWMGIGIYCSRSILEGLCWFELCPFIHHPPVQFLSFNIKTFSLSAEENHCFTWIFSSSIALLCILVALWPLWHPHKIKHQKKPDGAVYTFIYEKITTLFERWLNKCSTKFKTEYGLLSEAVELNWV